MKGTFGSYCDSTSTHYYPAVQQLPKTIYIVACVVNVISSVTSTFGNTLILLALRKCRSLRSSSKALLYSLALTDLFVGVVVLPLFTAYYLMIILEIPRYYCVVAITYSTTSTFIGAVCLETIATIAVDRYLAFHARLRYRKLMKFRRIVSILVIEWIIAAARSGFGLWNGQVDLVSLVVGLSVCCLLTSLCYVSIYRGLRHHVAHIQQQMNSNGSTAFNIGQYRRTVNNMLWINGFLFVCYLPYLASLLTILAIGLSDTTRFLLHFSASVIFLNSSLNPILYCWKIKELRENVIALLSCLRPLLNLFSSLAQ